MRYRIWIVLALVIMLVSACGDQLAGIEWNENIIMEAGNQYILPKGRCAVKYQTSSNNLMDFNIYITGEYRDQLDAEIYLGEDSKVRLLDRFDKVFSDTKAPYDHLAFMPSNFSTGIYYMVLTQEGSEGGRVLPFLTDSVRRNDFFIHCE